MSKRSDINLHCNFKYFDYTIADSSEHGKYVLIHKVCYIRENIPTYIKEKIFN